MAQVTDCSLIVPTLGRRVRGERCDAVPGHRLQRIRYVRRHVRATLLPVQDERMLQQLTVFWTKTLIFN